MCPGWEQGFPGPSLNLPRQHFGIPSAEQALCADLQRESGVEACNLGHEFWWSHLWAVDTSPTDGLANDSVSGCLSRELPALSPGSTGGSLELNTLSRPCKTSGEVALGQELGLGHVHTPGGPQVPSSLPSHTASRSPRPDLGEPLESWGSTRQAVSTHRCPQVVAPRASIPGLKPLQCPAVWLGVGSLAFPGPQLVHLCLTCR